MNIDTKDVVKIINSSKGKFFSAIFIKKRWYSKNYEL